LKLKETTGQLQNDGVLPAGGTPRPERNIPFRDERSLEGIQCERRPPVASRRVLVWLVEREALAARLSRRR